MKDIALNDMRSEAPRETPFLSLASELPVEPPRLAPRFGSVALLEASLVASLEQLHTPTFIVGPDGVIAANGRGRELLLRDGTLLSRMQDGAGDAGLFDRIPLAVPGFPGFHLVTCRGAPESLRSRAALFVRRWRLTPRQGEVLALLVQGLPNKAIAAELICAERTIEQHVRHLFQKADVTSRAALTARFWTGG